MATAIMEAGWNTERLSELITRWPASNRVRTTVSVIIAARLRAVHAYPPLATSDSPHRHRSPGAPGAGRVIQLR
ncbi:hypothetical protein [Streptomyces cadmiisoli]|uniref:hypothetical protein n=1 Tax=Streptomyces cadmiisoli TaxID=2184053 RepID=UPI0013A6F896|nr:hypothetical protein [Streptomyces cadmiisoli]